MIRIALALSAVLLLAAPTVAAAHDEMPGQEMMDQAGSSMTQGNWSDLPGGTAPRPYVKSLTVVNGTQSVPVFSGGVSAAAAAQIGDVSAVVSPVNLCRTGQAPTPGVCYATPNRVGISFGYKTDRGMARDFANPSVALRQTVTQDTVFDVVIALNTLGRTLRWTWANGELVDWKTTALGSDAAEIRLRIKPSVTPDVDWSKHAAGGCTATPIRDCNLDRADGQLLGSELVLSLDESLSEALTGAVFATQGAIAGFLEPGGSAAAPTLDLQMASSHLAADGSPQRGTLRAFLPAQGLLGLYGVLPADAATFFTATRRGASGTQDPPRFEARTASETSSDGLLVTVSNVTFSAPTYRVARKATPVRVRTAVRGRRTSVSTAALSGCRRRACTVTVYRTIGRLGERVTKVGNGRTDARGAAALQLATAKLPRRSRFVVAVRRAGKLVTTAQGTVR